MREHYCLSGCHFSLRVWEDGATFYSLHTDKTMRGKGLAKKVVRAVRKWADRKNCPVVLWVGPFLDKPMSAEQLEAFYSKMGFRVFQRDRNVWMGYHPERK